MTIVMADIHPPPIDPAGDALFLDFDGTLVEFADHPDAVKVQPTLIDTLDALSGRLDGALALISGRAISSIDRQTAPLRLPAAGVHGLELRHGDERIRRNEAEAARLAPARAHIAGLLSETDEIRVEDKDGAIVLHFRTAPHSAGRARAIATAAAGCNDGLVAVDGHAIAEIRPKAVTKAGAIVELLKRDPFAGRRPIFVGDDVTDEDGFRAASRAGGFGIKVGPGETAATYRLADVAAVHAWLAACRGGRNAPMPAGAEEN